MKQYTVTTTAGEGLPSETTYSVPELGDPCAKCHERPSTREIVVMTEHPGGVAYYCDDCAKGPQWSAEPPREPGWYWERDLLSEPFDFYPVRLLGDTRPTNGLEWWPVPIEPPK